MERSQKEMQERAALNAKHRELQAQDAKQAMIDYETAGRELREKTAKLRALRLAKEAAERDAPAAPPKPAEKAAVAPKKVTAAPKQKPRGKPRGS